MHRARLVRSVLPDCQKCLAKIARQTPEDWLVASRAYCCIERSFICRPTRSSQRC